MSETVMNKVMQKEFVVQRNANSIDKEKRTLQAVMSTSVMDRQGDIVEPLGLDFTNYMKNPVVLWAHDLLQPPIARVSIVSTETGVPVASIQFADTVFAREIFELYSDGFLNAWSVGFIPKQFSRIETEEKYMGVHVRTAEVVELSAVPVPANPEAVTKSVQEKQEVVRASGTLFIPANPTDQHVKMLVSVDEKSKMSIDTNTSIIISPKAFHKSSKEIGDKGIVTVSVTEITEDTKDVEGTTILFDVYDSKEGLITQAKLKSINIVLPKNLQASDVHSKESNHKETEVEKDDGTNVSDETICDSVALEVDGELLDMECADILNSCNGVF